MPNPIYNLVMIKFETADRYYVIELSVDLLSDLVVTCYYGARHSKLNHMRTYLVENQHQAQQVIERISKIRFKHGYDLVFDQYNWLG